MVYTTSTYAEISVFFESKNNIRPYLLEIMDFPFFSREILVAHRILLFFFQKTINTLIKDFSSRFCFPLHSNTLIKGFSTSFCFPLHSNALIKSFSTRFWFSSFKNKLYTFPQKILFILCLFSICFFIHVIDHQSNKILMKMYL